MDDALLGGFVESTDRRGDRERSVAGGPSKGNFGRLLDERLRLTLGATVHVAAAE